MDRKQLIISNSEEETFNIGKNFSLKLKSGDIVCFHGDLGAGKTVFIKGLISKITNFSIEDITSPTFVYLNSYSFKKYNICHFDLYRIKDEEQFFSFGFDEYLDGKNICCIEWAERIKSFLPKNVKNIFIENIDKNKRFIRWD